MSTLTCWINASQDPTKSTVWLRDQSGLLKDSIFLNLESKEASFVLSSLMREAFAKGTSFAVMVDVRDIKISDKTQAKSVKASLDFILDNMIETVKVETPKLSDTTLAKANAILATLDARPKVDRVAVGTSTHDEDIFDFLVD